MIHGQLQGCAAAHAVTNHVRPLDTEMVEQPNDVARQVGGREITSDVGRAAMGLEVDADHPMSLSQGWQQAGKRQIDGHDPAV